MRHCAKMVIFNTGISIYFYGQALTSASTDENRATVMSSQVALHFIAGYGPLLRLLPKRRLQVKQIGSQFAVPSLLCLQPTA